MNRCRASVVLQVDLRVADERRVQRRLGDVDVARLDERPHLAQEERQQQRADVRAVDVGVGEDDHLVVADLREVEVVGDAGTDRHDQRLDLGVLQHLVDARLLDVQDLAANRQDRLGPRIARRRLADPAAEFPSTMNISDSVGSRDEQSTSLPGRPAPSRADLRRVRSRAWRAAMRGTLREQRLLHDLVRLARVLLHPLGELLVRRPLDERTDRDVAELALGLTLELRIRAGAPRRSP